MTETGVRRVPLAKLLWGVVLIVLGILFTLDNADIIDVGDYWRFWPVILIAMGVAKFTQPEGSERRGSGVWLIMIGSWLLVGSLELFGLDYGTSWPLLIVAVGVSIIWQALTPRPAKSVDEGSQNGTS